MIIQNTDRTAKTKMYYVIFFINVVAFSFYNIFEHNATWIEWLVWGVVALLTLSYITMLYLKLNYFYVEQKGDKLIIRFYTAHPVGRKYKAIELPLRTIVDYDVVTNFFGFKKELYLTAKTPKGVFNFPPLSISLLNKREIEHLEYILKPLVTK